ncbi:GNAT family N-acetyltransferase [Virgibacillus kekensis]|uniref:GNAT family N-acetyltransferase n=1 Tax=Virgibacillus kekensis TaxID=202261 RepID=A0ABV9DK72_9BACI
MIETERCFIKAFQKSDANDVKELYTNQEVRKFLGGIPSESTILETIEGMIFPEEDAFFWVIKEKETKMFIGLVSLSSHHEGDIEISYQLHPDWWGKGYATEVVEKIIHYAFNELKISKLVAETQTANKSSCSLLERLGMNLEKKIIRFGAEQALHSIRSYNNDGY